MPSVQMNENVLNRLRNFVALEYGGKIWGKISENIEIAVMNYLDIREGCRRDFISEKDTGQCKPKYSGFKGTSLVMLSPIEGTTQRIIIPAEEGYWIKLTLKDITGKEIPDNTSLFPCIETETPRRSIQLDSYKYGELKRETGKLKRQIYIKPNEELVIYIEKNIKISDIKVEFVEFAVDSCAK
jgi:hypothetical protein